MAESGACSLETTAEANTVGWCCVLKTVQPACLCNAHCTANQEPGWLPPVPPKSGQGGTEGFSKAIQVTQLTSS